MQGIVAIIAGVVAFVLAGMVKPAKIVLALAYGLIWVVIGLVLDAAVTMRFNAEIFSSWSLWFGYLLVLLAPILKVEKSSETPKTEPAGMPN